MSNQQPTSVTVESWEVASLKLDEDNFRLPPTLGKTEQGELIQYFLRNYDLEELGYSMAKAGYFDEEPLLTIDHPNNPDFKIVVEGNRRLAALKLLTDASARDGAPPIWHELSQLAETNGHDLTSVPIRNYAARQLLREYLGFRHVSGLMPWKAEAKARYIHELITKYGYLFRDAAQAIGSRSDAIRRQFLAYEALRQAEKADVDVTLATRHFGVYYRALQNPRIRNFLRLEGWTEATPETRDPLASDGTERLAALIEWVFGPNRVIKDSRQLDDLGEALADDAATAMLRSTGDLSLALAELPPDRDAMASAIRSAFRNLARANGLAFEFAGDEQLLDEVLRVQKVLESLIGALQLQGTEGS